MCIHPPKKNHFNRKHIKKTFSTSILLFYIKAYKNKTSVCVCMSFCVCSIALYTDISGSRCTEQMSSPIPKITKISFSTMYCIVETVCIYIIKDDIRYINSQLDVIFVRFPIFLKVFVCKLIRWYGDNFHSLERKIRQTYKNDAKIFWRELSFRTDCTMFISFKFRKLDSSSYMMVFHLRLWQL